MDATANDVPSPYEVRGYVSLEASLETDFFKNTTPYNCVYNCDNTWIIQSLIIWSEDGTAEEKKGV